MTTTPNPTLIPLFEGPQDPSQLLWTINRLIQLINAAMWALVSAGLPQAISPLVTANGVWDGTFAFVPVSSQNGSLTYEVPAGFGTAIAAKEVIIFLAGTGSGSCSVIDNLGNELAFLSSSGTAFAICASTDSTVYAGSKT